MKKKTIKELPFQTNIEIPKEFKYLAAVSLKKLEENTLLIDIYDPAPLCRIALTTTDYTTYFAKDGSWSTAMITNYNTYGTIWHNSNNNNWVLEHTLIPERDIEKIKRFTKREHSGWIWAISQYQDDIKEIKEKRREGNWKAALEKRMSETPPHSAGFVAWAKGQIPKNFLYYLRKGNYAYVTCSRCGQREKYYTGNIDTFEQQFIKRIDIPRREEPGRCLKCGATGIFKCEGRQQRSYTVTKRVYDVQKWKETGVCISLVEVSKTYEIGTEEAYQIRDKAKFWYQEGRKTPECAYNHGNNKESWKRSNIEWGSKIEAGDREVYIGGLSQLKGTCLQYSGFPEYRCNIVRYMNTYLKHPELELLSKMKFSKIVDQMLSFGPPTINVKGKSIADKLSIRPERVKELQKKKGEARAWDLYKMERNCGVLIPDVMCKQILRNHSNRIMDIGTIFGYVTPRKFETYINKIGWDQIVTYRDYLTMCDEQGYDMTDPIILFPKDLRTQHNKLVLEKNKAEREKRIKEKNEEYSEISQMYKKLKKDYGYEDEKFIIRPAKDAGELVSESAILHHCVGTSDTYMEKHKNKNSFILFLRKVQTPEVPYCTVEIAPDGRIIQWQQEYDQKPDREVLEPWLQQYEERLKTKIGV